MEMDPDIQSRILIGAWEILQKRLKDCRTQRLQGHHKRTHRTNWLGLIDPNRDWTDNQGTACDWSSCSACMLQFCNLVSCENHKSQQGLSLNMLPAFGTYSFYRIASHSLNRRGGAYFHIKLINLGWQSMGGQPVYKKK